MPAITLPKKWVPDEDRPACPFCKRDFTLFFRRHHCRLCGEVVCNDCSCLADFPQLHPQLAEVIRSCRQCVKKAESIMEEQKLQRLEAKMNQVMSQKKKQKVFSLKSNPTAEVQGSLYTASEEPVYRKHQFGVELDDVMLIASLAGLIVFWIMRCVQDLFSGSPSFHYLSVIASNNSVQAFPTLIAVFVTAVYVSRLKRISEETAEKAKQLSSESTSLNTVTASQSTEPGTSIASSLPPLSTRDDLKGDEVYCASGRPGFSLLKVQIQAADTSDGKAFCTEGTIEEETVDFTASRVAIHTSLNGTAGAFSGPFRYIQGSERADTITFKVTPECGPIIGMRRIVSLEQVIDDGAGNQSGSDEKKYDASTIYRSDIFAGDPVEIGSFRPREQVYTHRFQDIVPGSLSALIGKVYLHSRLEDHKGNLLACWRQHVRYCTTSPFRMIKSGTVFDKTSDDRAAESYDYTNLETMKGLEQYPLGYEIEEGCASTDSITFQVLADITGFEKHEVTFKGNFKVNTSSKPIGNGDFKARDEPYTYVFPTNQAPSGWLARGSYKMDMCYRDSNETEYDPVKLPVDIVKRGKRRK